jgi:hypothetical protein
VVLRRWAIALALLSTCALLAANPLENIRTDSWVYEAVDNLKLAGLIKTVPSSSRPWTVGYATSLVREANANPRATKVRGATAWWLKRLQGEFNLTPPNAMCVVQNPPYPHWSPVARIPLDSGSINVDLFDRIKADTGNQSASLGILFNTSGSDRLVLHSRMEFIGFTHKIPDVLHPDSITYVPGTGEHSWMGRALFDMPEAYMRFKIPWLELEVGRDYLYWGPGYLSSVMLSNTAPPLDQVQLTGTYRRLKLIYFASALSPWKNYHRYVSGQRLEVNFWNHLVLGGGMFAGFSPDSAQTKTTWGYFEPLLPIYFELANSGQDDNLAVGGDATLYLSHVKLYGQLLIDNYEFIDHTPDTSNQRPPNAYGLQFGLLATPFASTDFRLEYSKVTEYTYYHRIFQTALTQYDVPLGDELGPDADELFAQFMWYPLSWGEIGIAASQTRRGDRNRGTDQNKTWIWGPGYRSSQFPTGVVEKTLAVGPRVTFNPTSWLRCNAGLDYTSTTNVAGDSTRNARGPAFQVELQYRY